MNSPPVRACSNRKLAGEFVFNEIGRGGRIAAEADRAVKPPKCFRRPTRRSRTSFHRTRPRVALGADAAPAVGSKGRSPECLKRDGVSLNRFGIPKSVYF